MSKEIRITDNFMFATIMHDEKICKPFIERMLGIRIEKIKYVERELDLRADPYSKGIRLDVYVKDSDRVFSLEMQCINRDDLPLRTRYYQGLQDISFLDKGNLYRHLPESYILFICLFDLFKKGLPVYTFENTCKEDISVPLNDKCRKVFYNVNAWEKEMNPERRKLLKFFYNDEAEDKLTEAIQEQVSFTRNLREWRKEHMTLEQEIQLQASYAYDDGVHDKAVETATILYGKGMSVEEISEITKLNTAEISQIIKSGKNA